MGLLSTPPTREQTATSASQVKANTTNAVQDAIIRIREEKRILLYAQDFKSQRTGTTGKLGASFDRWIKDAASTFAVETGIWGIPVGATITKIEAYCKRGNVASSSFLLELRRYAKNAAPGVDTSVGSTSDNGTDGAYTTLTLTVNHVVLADNLYWWYTSQSSQAAGAGFEHIGGAIYYYPA